MDPMTLSHSTMPAYPNTPVTAALRSVLGNERDERVVADLMYLERWEMAPMPGIASALRVSQIRRANPELAAAVRAELLTLRG